MDIVDNDGQIADKDLFCVYSNLCLNDSHLLKITYGISPVDWLRPNRMRCKSIRNCVVLKCLVLLEMQSLMLSVHV